MPAPSPTRLQIDVLGSLEVRADGVRLEVHGSRRRSLLVLLALNAGRSVAVDRIADVLTDGGPDEHAIATVRTYLSKLRAELGPAAGAIRTRDRGYVLDVPEEAVDAHRFRRLVVAARGGSPPHRLEHAEAALALWRGTPLAGVDGRWGRSEAAALVDLRIEAVRGLADARTVLGDAAGATQALGDLLREHPTREDIAVALMRQLYRAGRQADALETYARVRDRLAQELGIHPGPALRSLHSAILAQDRRVLDPLRPADWPVRGTTPGSAPGSGLGSAPGSGLESAAGLEPV